MAKRNSDNLRIKRKYLVWRKEAKGLSDASVDKSASAISTYEAFLDAWLISPRDLVTLAERKRVRLNVPSGVRR